VQKRLQLSHTVSHIPREMRAARLRLARSPACRTSPRRNRLLVGKIDFLPPCVFVCELERARLSPGRLRRGRVGGGSAAPSPPLPPIGTMPAASPRARQRRATRSPSPAARSLASPRAQGVEGSDPGQASGPLSGAGVLLGLLCTIALCVAGYPTYPAPPRLPTPHPGRRPEAGDLGKMRAPADPGGGPPPGGVV